MTFADIVADKSSYIGGRITTWESGLEYRGNIIDIILTEKLFIVYCDDGKDINVAIYMSKVVEDDRGLASFSIPYVGVAYLHKK